MKACSSVPWAILVAVSMAGCAMRPAASDADDGAGRSTAITAERATNAVAIGRSTPPDVRAALGEAAVVRFDSGFEVWVYPIADDASARPGSTRPRPHDERRANQAEFVILFAPTGRVAKTRLRSASAAVQ